PIPDISTADTIFGSTKYLPKMSDIPEEFKHGSEVSNIWLKAQSDWFFGGIKENQLKPKPGVNKSKALRVLQAIQVSFEPKHEHKAAGVAYLLSEWFESYAPEKC